MVAGQLSPSGQYYHHHYVHHHFGSSNPRSRYNPILGMLGCIYLTLLVTTFRRHLQHDDHFHNLHHLHLQGRRTTSIVATSTASRSNVLSLADQLEHHAQSMSLQHQKDNGDDENNSASHSNKKHQGSHNVELSLAAANVIKAGKIPAGLIDDQQRPSRQTLPLQQPMEQPPRPRPTHPSSNNNSPPPPPPPDHTMGICLLIKDDNDLLPEFIAYHYHAVDLRHLVVAVDPTSATTPIPILERSHSLLPDFTFVVWNDADYMYDWFLAGNYSRIPDFIGKNFNTTTKKSIWHDSPQFHEAAKNNDTSVEKEILQGINIHRFRQAVFVGECIRHMKDESIRTSTINSLGKDNNQNDDASSGGGMMTNNNPSNTTTTITAATNRLRQVSSKNQQQLPKSSSSSSSSPSYLKYMAHIDTDEMLVVNPHFLARDVGKNDPKFHNLTVGTTDYDAGKGIEQNPRTPNQPWMTLESSSVRQLLEVWHEQYPFTERSCRYLPRVLFGSVERGEISKSSAVRKLPAVVPPIDSSLVPDGFDSTKFESLRFKWHAAWNDNPVNGFGKVILDLDELRKGREAILKPKARVSGIHQISPNLCGKNLPYTSKIWDNRPLATYHYLGSEERHCGKDDPRRNSKLHHKKSITGSKFPDSVWLDQWLSRFVEIHGLNKSRQLLPEYLKS